VQPKIWDDHIRADDAESPVTPLMQGNANVNSVEPPLAPQKQRIKTTSQMQLMTTTERQFFMKAKSSQVSLIL
jgi:hypothetical protein